LSSGRVALNFGDWRIELPLSRKLRRVLDEGAARAGDQVAVGEEVVGLESEVERLDLVEGLLAIDLLA
jgi:hypothetical protein